MKLIVTRKDIVAADTVRVRLAAKDHGELPEFKPGAHIELTVNGLIRWYSLTSSPRAREFYEICVLYARPSRGGSAYVHDVLRVGDIVEAAGPFNAFALNVEAEHSVFIAGGIGITPFYTMMEALDGNAKSFELHYAARTADRFLPLPRYPAKIVRHVDEGGAPGLDVERLLRGLDRDCELYVCGPRPLIEAVRLAAAALGRPRQTVHFESFGSAQRPGDNPIAVTFAQSGVVVEVRPGVSILEAARDAGVWAPFECRRGECGACVTEIRSGKADHRDVCLTPAQRERALCTCVSWAADGELVLEL